MIYWDNAATTWPKPRSVCRAIGQALERYGANPGRAGHRMSMETAGMVYDCRRNIADFFGLKNENGVIFTSNCTASLNMVIRSILGQGGRAVVSDLEHNAVVRPLTALSPMSSYDIAPWSPDPTQTVENFRRAIGPNTKLILCTHASNVFGVLNPIPQLGELAREYGLYFCVDAAQTAGVLPIDMEKYHIDFLCVAPHKGLYAPMGTGLLLCREMDKIQPIVYGGTGSYSMMPTQPKELPDRLESGTQNIPGICGVAAGLRFVQERGVSTIYRHEISCLQHLYHRLMLLPFLDIYTPYPRLGETAPVLSVNVKGKASEEVAEWLDKNGVAVRAGLHCAPWAHRRFGTLEQGTIRLVPSAFSTVEEAEKIAKVFSQFAEKSLHRSKSML